MISVKCHEQFLYLHDDHFHATVVNVDPNYEPLYYEQEFTDAGDYVPPVSGDIVCSQKHGLFFMKNVISF